MSTQNMSTIRLSKQTRSILERIAANYNSELDRGDNGRGLNCDIQLALCCSLGRAICYANEIRIGRIRKAA